MSSARRTRPLFSQWNSATRGAVPGEELDDDTPQLMINSQYYSTQKPLSLAKHHSPIMEHSGVYGRRDSTGSCSAYSLSSFDTTVRPVSPSPRCSSLLLSGPSTSIPGSPVSTEDDFFYSQTSNDDASSPRNNIDAATANKRIWGLGAEEMSEIGKELSSNMEGLRGYSSCDGYRFMDTVCPPPPPLMPMPQPVLPAVREEQEAVEEISHDELSSSITGVETMSMTRPRPYNDFLDEVKKKEFEDHIDAWKEAKHTKLMNKLRKRENAINAWEHKQTWKATMEMKKTENELERQRSMALMKMKESISDITKKADEKRARERQSTMNAIAKVTRTADKSRDSRSRIRLKLYLC
ncbi:hypothetical protein Scep_007034 [Stephania cephalantha]|uniref:Remorin C-terminal domain-containing protein n=1 Tax=Stephania cephalantha TaxID=152367 RepID=A0AAP0KBN3_9MAGN